MVRARGRAVVVRGRAAEGRVAKGASRGPSSRAGGGSDDPRVVFVVVVVSAVPFRRSVFSPPLRNGGGRFRATDPSACAGFP